MDLRIEGMHCGSCAARIEGALAKLPGASDVSVNYATRKARVTGPVPFDAIETTVKKLGYAAFEAVDEAIGFGGGQNLDKKIDPVKEMTAEYRRVIAAAALALPVFVVGMGHLMFLGSDWLQLILTTALILGPGRGFFTRAARLLLHRGVNMDTLIALGVSSAFAASVASLSSGGHHLYFESAAVIIAFVLLGQSFEARARNSSADAIEKLRALRPEFVRVRRPNGREEEISLDQLNEGDVFLVRPGEQVAIDGVIVEGESIFDEALVTGEAVPALRKKGEEVTGSTINAGKVVVLVRSTVAAKDTVLARIVSLVEDAQAGKASVQRLADKVARVFVPVVLAIAALTLFYWLTFGGATPSAAILNAVSVLVIACPCALGLATPTAILAGTGRAAERLILIRSAPGLEKTGALTTLVVDKTGTLTEGRPAVSGLTIEPGFSEREILALASAAESASSHPLAKAIFSYAEHHGAELSSRLSAEERPGLGLAAQILFDGKMRDARFGTLEFVQEGSSVVPSGWAERANETPDGLVFVAVDRTPAAVFSLRDPIRSNTLAAVRALQFSGLEIVMATGDRQEVAINVAKELGIETVRAGMKPGDKMQLIAEMQALGKVVGMVGDGINDAPALSQADVGIAVGSGSAIALDSADVVIPHGNLAKIVEVSNISKKTMAVIRQNLGWAFVYNILAIPIAAAGGLTPMIAAGAMAVSSASVVANSMRLRRMRPGV